MAASLALAGLSGCSVAPAPSSKIVPYVQQPEELVPGRPLFYATAMTLGGVGVGLLAESHLGRPTKIEGNPWHPGSLGATDLFHQASVLTLYDPDRSQIVTVLGKPSTWDAVLGSLPVQGVPSPGSALARLQAAGRRGAGLCLLTETVVSPTLHSQIQDLKKVYPRARWYQYEPLAPDNVRQASRSAFGKDVHTVYNLKEATRVLSFDADFLGCGPGHLHYVADFASRRRVRTSKDDASKAEMNRLYVVETSVTRTGAKADHRLALPAQDIERLAWDLAARLGVIAGGPKAGPHEDWVQAVVKDLQENRNNGHQSLILAGPRQPAAVHVLVHALNQHLGNVGKTVLYTDPIEPKPANHLESLQKLTQDMEQGEIEVLLILGGNPVFTAPADVPFAQALLHLSQKKGACTAHLSLHQDETSQLCQWQLPEAHFLESWSDTRGFDGTASIVQPLIDPLYQGRSAHELLAALTGSTPLPGYQVVREFSRNFWHKQQTSGDFETFWQIALHDGIVAGTSFQAQSLTLRPGWQAGLPAPPRGGSSPEGTESYEIVFEPDPTIYDGRFANNGWLQELPKPLTTLTWDNAALMSPATAKHLGISWGSYAHGGEHGGYYMPVVELKLDDRIVEAPVWIMPGHANESITVHLGYGREKAGRVGGDQDHRVGFDAYRLRTSNHPWFAGGLTIRQTGKNQLLACTQQHHLMENRQTVRAGTLKEYQSPEGTDFAAKKEQELEREETLRAPKPLTLYKPMPPSEHKWGMVIDLTTCVGCQACVVACQAENNIPVVGKEQVAAGREMHWLRIDRYLSGSMDKPTEFHFQPVPCMQCENAPCEYVCPVEATVHSADGLNDMNYQRCVGTRFCSNNCPYKVRRFNFLFYADYATQSLRLQYNPDVTVRSRGVMEKCTYCVQRLRQADIDAQKEGRPIRDGEVMTACQAACPARAIVFGDLNDPASTVKKWKESPLNYGLLADLNTQPRTTYLAALRNPNPDLEP